MWSHWVLKKFKALKLAENLKALLIYDVFMGQITGAVSRLLEDDQRFVQHVTNNHTSFFQLFDVSVNFLSKIGIQVYEFLNHTM